MSNLVVIGFDDEHKAFELRATLAKLNSGALGNLNWIEQRPLASGAEAFSELLQGRCAAPKIVLRTD